MNEYSFISQSNLLSGWTMNKKSTQKYMLILDAAVKVFADTGYHGSQVSKIAREAGVADGTIYLYFKNKEDILISLFRERLGELFGKFNASVSSSLSAAEALHQICDIHFTELENDPTLAYVTQIELRQSSLELRKEIGRTVKPYLQLIETIITKGIEDGLFRSDLDPKLTRHLLFGGMDEVVTSWLVSGRTYSLRSKVSGTVAFFLQALKA